jgi:hypothetical protein
MPIIRAEENIRFLQLSNQPQHTFLLFQPKNNDINNLKIKTIY